MCACVHSLIRGHTHSNPNPSESPTNWWELSKGMMAPPPLITISPWWCRLALGVIKKGAGIQGLNWSLVEFSLPPSLPPSLLTHNYKYSGCCKACRPSSASNTINLHRSSSPFQNYNLQLQPPYVRTTYKLEESLSNILTNLLLGPPRTPPSSSLTCFQ